MILVENSSFGPSRDSDFASASHQTLFDSPNPNEPFLDLDEIDQLLSGTQPESKANANTDFCDYFENEDEDEEFLELDLSDSSSQDQEDDLSSLTPSVQRLLCQTSMSNYSSASSAISSLIDDVGTRLSESKKATNLAKPSLTKSTYIFGTAFDNGSSCGSGSSASSSTPSTPSSTIGAFSTVPHPAISSSSALPSFSEIYSPRYKGGRTQFNYSGDFFKFEDYISEGDSASGSEADFENSSALLGPAIHHLTSGGDTVPSNHQAFDLLHPHIILKEEPMDSFMPSSSTLESVLQMKPCTSKYSTGSSEHLHQQQHQFMGQQMQPSTSEVTSKMEPEEHKQSEMLFRAESPKPMRYHLHSLSLNVMQAGLCEPPTFDDTFDSMETDPVDRVSANVTPFEQSLLQAGSMMMSGSASMSSIIVPPTSLDSANSNQIMVEPSTGSYRSNKPRNQRNKSMQMQICAVCGDVAACQHYGVLTCEGCKGFFKRTVQKGSKYTCLGNKDCTVDKRRRNRCQFCRFQKCLAVGMVKEVVRTDSLKGRRGRLPSKPKSPQEVPQFPPMSMITALVRAHLDTSADKANLDFSQYNDGICDKSQIESRIRDFIDRQLLIMLNSSLDSLYAFMEKIPGFNELNEFDRRLLFQHSCLELFALRMAYRLKPGSAYIILCNNIVLHRSQFAVSFGEWLPHIENLSHQLHAMEIDMSAFACLCALTVITGRSALQDSNKVDQLETKIINSLKDHTVYNSEAQKKPNYFSKILSKLPDLRSIGAQGTTVINDILARLSINLPAEIRELQRKINPTPSGVESSCMDLPSITSFFGERWPVMK